MLCSKCQKHNDSDAVFCENCGAALAATPAHGVVGKGQRALFATALAAVILAIIAIGYYKFFLPGGIAAVVNGEEISLAEVNSLMRGAEGIENLPPELVSRARYRVLNDLITERIAWQEARKGGVRAEPAEVEAAYGQLAASAAGGPGAFEAQVRSQYGSVRAFQQSLERRIAIRKYINAQVTAGITDPTIAGARLNQWLQAVSARSSVRVALAEQLPGAAGGGCGSGGGCGTKAGGGCGSGGGCSSAPRTGAEASPQAREAEKAALAWWRDRYGSEAVAAKVLDFGCHIQVDMMKGEQIARSLRYQNGSISEL